MSCVEGVVYWSVPTSIPHNLILDFQQRYTSDRSKKTLKLPKIEESEDRQHCKDLRKIEGVHQEIKNDTEIRVECQE